MRALLGAPLIAAALVVAAVVLCAREGIAFRDPDGVAVQYVVIVGAGVALVVALDIVLRARRRAGRVTREAFAAVRRERWTRGRIGAVALGIVAFYAAYLAYRNLKALIPFARPGVLHDAALARLDRDVFLGHDPAALLHGLFGTGVAAHVLSTFYAAFIVFLPLSLAVVLVFSERLRTALFYTAALCLNWVIGAATYLALPALGPIYAYPGWFADLPRTEATRLQQMLLDDRIGFLADPATGTPQAIAAFVSLHIAMSVTALATAHLVRADRRLRIALWAWLVLTLLATVYLGWHYVVDDVAGAAVGLLSLALAWAVTGVDPRPAAWVDRAGGSARPREGLRPPAAAREAAGLRDGGREEVRG